MARIPPLVHLVLTALLSAATALPVAAARASRLELHPCAGVAALCGELPRPLDPSGRVPGRISVHFEFYPHTGTGPALGTLVATEGGPGYPATLSRADYLELFGPLRRRRDVILMDNRGTGRSGAIDCGALQVAPRWTIEGVAACGRSLGAQAPFYGTAYATDDLAAVLRALGVRRIDLYGDSYGTYFAQTFALRHPRVLRSIVLDGAYPLDGPDYAWYPNYAPAMRAKFDLACRRSPRCARRPGDAITQILPALRALRSAPFAAMAEDADGRRRRFEASASLLATVMFASAPALATVRETDAAARAFSAGDQAPLLRLMAETLSGVDSRDPSDAPAKWSAGLAAAVLCGDPPQIFDMNLPPPLRAIERDRAVANYALRHPLAYAPFTIDEYRRMPLDYSFLDECVAWPHHPGVRPIDPAHGPTPAYPDIPALIVSGDLDDITPVADGAEVARAFPHGRQVVIENGFHVNALPRGRSRCAARIVRRFLRTLEVDADACAAPAVRLLPRFATRAATLSPAYPSAGNRVDTGSLRVARAAVLTVGDVVVRAAQNTRGAGPGLRGGTFRVRAGGRRLELDSVRWTEDVAVSGTIRVGARPERPIVADIRIAGPEGLRGRLRIAWLDEPADARASIVGRLGGAPVRATTPAP